MGSIVASFLVLLLTSTVRAQPAPPVAAIRLQPIPDAVKGALEHSESQLRDIATAGMTDAEVGELESVAVLCAQGQTRDAVAKWEALLGGMKARGVEANFGSHSGLTAGRAGGDIMAMVYFVFRESIVQQNEDKKFWIEKLKQYNLIGEALSDYLKDLFEASTSLAADSEDEGDSAVLSRPLAVQMRGGQLVVPREPVRLSSSREVAAEKRRTEARLAHAQERVTEAREAIYRKLRDDPEKLERYQDLQDLLLNRARTVYLPKRPPRLRVSPRLRDPE